MAKTKMSDKKRRELLPLIYKVVKEKYEHCDDDKFNAMCKEKFSKKLDEYILEYYKDYDFYKNNQNILLELGLLSTTREWLRIGYIENNTFGLCFNRCFVSNLGIGVMRHQKAEIDCMTFIRNRIELDKIHDVYFKMCKDFIENVYIHAKPLYQFVMSAKYCEDILEHWDSADVRKILLPEKIYPISPITQEQLEAVKNLLSK